MATLHASQLQILQIGRLYGDRFGITGEVKTLQLLEMEIGFLQPNYVDQVENLERRKTCAEVYKVFIVNPHKFKG
jgi:hypothetical protein